MTPPKLPESSREPETPKALAPVSCSAELRALAEKLEKERCEHFPHIICDEMPGITFDTWCEPCKARAIMRYFREMDARQNDQAEAQPSRKEP